MPRGIKKKQQETLRLEEIIAGYKKLAFGSCNDALRLMTEEASLTPELLETLDLSLISEIKHPKGGGFEIKFFNRFEALLRLEQLASSHQGADSLQRFYQAIAEGASHSAALTSSDSSLDSSLDSSSEPASDP